MGRSGSRLPSADGNQVVSGRDEAITRFIHVAEVACAKGQLYVLLLPRLQMDPREPAQRLQWRAGELREADIEFSHFVSIAVARVLDVHLDIQGIACLQLRV